MNRLRLIFSTVSYYGDVIKSCSLTQEIAGAGEELSVDYFDCTLKLDSAAIVKKHEKVQVWFGLSYLGTYYRTDFRQIDEKLYALKFQSILGVIDQKQFAGGLYSAAPLSSVIAEITGTSLLDPWHVQIDSAYAGTVVSGYIPPCTWREALGQVAFAVGACVSSAATNGIGFFPPKTATAEITRAEIFNTLDITEYQPVTAVKVAAHRYEQTSETAGENIFEFTGKYYRDTVTYQTVTNDAAADADENIVTVTDATLVHAGNIAAVCSRLAAYYFRRVTWKNKIVAGSHTVGGRVRVPAFAGTRMAGNIRRMQYSDIGYKLFSEIELDGHYSDVFTLTVMYTDTVGGQLKTYVSTYTEGEAYSVISTVIDTETGGRSVYLPRRQTVSGTMDGDKNETVVCDAAALSRGETLFLYASDAAAADGGALIIE